jgi:hypothetical protein
MGYDTLEMFFLQGTLVEKKQRLLPVKGVIMTKK